MAKIFSQSPPKIILLVLRVWNKFGLWIIDKRLELMWILYYIFEGYGYINARYQGKQTWLTTKTIDFNNISDIVDIIFHTSVLVGLSIYFATLKSKEIAELKKEQPK